VLLCTDLQPFHVGTNCQQLWCDTPRPQHHWRVPQPIQHGALHTTRAGTPINHCCHTPSKVLQGRRNGHTATQLATDADNRGAMANRAQEPKGPSWQADFLSANYWITFSGSSTPSQQPVNHTPERNFRAFVQQLPMKTSCIGSEGQAGS
jgi:hypothetical protein